MVERDFTVDKSNMIKAIAVIGLLCHHMFNPSFLAERGFSPVFFFPAFTSWVQRQGILSIMLFTMISGYGIAVAMDKKNSVARCIYRREIGLLGTFVPIYFFTVLSLLIVRGAKHVLDIYYHENKITRIINALCDMLGIAYQYKKSYGFGTINMTWWYMPAAHYIILVVPFIVAIMKMQKNSGYAIWLFLLMWLGRTSNPSFYYSCILAATAGACFYEYRICEKVDCLFSKNILTRIAEAAIVAGILVFYFYYREITQVNNRYFMAVLVPVWFIVVESFVSKIPYLSSVLAKIGQYGGMFYMTHTLIYSKLTPVRNFIFSLKYAILSYLAAFAITLGLCVAIRFIEKKTGYLRLLDKLKNLTFSERAWCQKK